MSGTAARPRRVYRVAIGAVALCLSAPRLSHAACVGDCSGDGVVTVDELLRGVNMALGILPVTACPAFDVNGDGAITVDELLAAVNVALNGCPATPTTTKTNTASPSSTATATVTPTPHPNHAPLVPCFDIYRTYPGYPIAIALDATDPDGDRLHYTSNALPTGATLDELSGTLSWIPAVNQIGPLYVPFTVTDEGVPPASVEGIIVFQVAPLDACVQATCDAATGCRTSLPALDQDCCHAAPVPDPTEAMADCPHGRVVFVGRNADTGFGRLQNCDFLQVINSGQVSATVFFNVEARCLNASQPVRLHAVMSTRDRLVFDRTGDIIVQARNDGYLQRLKNSIAVNGPGPFFDLESAEANLTVTLTDTDGFTATVQRRVILTFDTLNDLTDVQDPTPPLATCPMQTVSSSAQ